MKNSLPGFYILSASTQVLYLVSTCQPASSLQTTVLRMGL